MKLLGLLLALALTLTGCNQTDTTKQQISENTTYDVSNVSDKTYNGKAVGKEYGGKGTGYGQVKKNEPVPPALDTQAEVTQFFENLQAELGTNYQYTITKHDDINKFSIDLVNVDLSNNLMDLRTPLTEHYGMTYTVYGSDNNSAKIYLRSDGTGVPMP